jgi:yecA family protein
MALRPDLGVGPCRSKECQLSSKEPRRRYLAKAEPPPLLPPNVATLEVQPFTPEDSQRLRTWLTESGWPRGTMDLAMLEGYLVALLAWPVSLSSGAWLPPIWGEKAGWRVPAKLFGTEPFNNFVGLVVSLLRDLDSRLVGPSKFVPTLLPDERGCRWPRATGVSWVHGFLKGLQQNAQVLQDRSPAARAAVTIIARYGSFDVPTTDARFAVVATDLQAAISVLLSERASRGPLGALNALPAAPKRSPRVRASIDCA